MKLIAVALHTVFPFKCAILVISRPVEHGDSIMKYILPIVDEKENWKLVDTLMNGTIISCEIKQRQWIFLETSWNVCVTQQLQNTAALEL